MAFSPDVLVTALQELMPGYSETFTKWHPAFDAIVKKGQKATAQGPYLEFALVPSGPGQITPILTGNEVIAGGRTMDSVRANTYAATMIYAYDVPGQDLREANGEMDLVRLIKRYPERAIMDFHERIARQLVSGDGAGAGSFPTWNGGANYDPKGLGPRQGMFEYAAPAAQNDVVFGVTKQGGAGVLRVGITNTETSHLSQVTVALKCVQRITMLVRKWLTQKVMLTCSSVTEVLSTTTSKTLTTKFKSSHLQLMPVTVLKASCVREFASSEPLSTQTSTSTLLLFQVQALQRTALFTEFTPAHGTCISWDMTQEWKLKVILFNVVLFVI
jgi:hypothetical protein